MIFDSWKHYCEHFFFKDNPLDPLDPLDPLVPLDLSNTVRTWMALVDTFGRKHKRGRHDADLRFFWKLVITVTVD